jgi:hypothetical protein
VELFDFAASALRVFGFPNPLVFGKKWITSVMMDVTTAIEWEVFGLLSDVMP